MEIEEKLVEKQQNKVDEPTTLIEKGFKLFLDSLSDNELVEFEKMLTEEFQEFTRKDEISDAQIETDFNELFTPARLSRAKEILDRSKPKEGISIFLNKDPNSSLRLMNISYVEKNEAILLTKTFYLLSIYGYVDIF